MIVGLLCRHYKIYQGLYFIPICDDYETPFSLFIGNNAVGKSSVLESLNTFFNNTNWNRTKGTKADETYIAPVFLIKKSDIQGNIDSIVYQKLDLISQYFWSVTEEANSNLKSNEEFKKFFQIRDELKHRYGANDYLFFLLGLEYQDKSEVYYSTFDDDINKKMKIHNISIKDIQLINEIKSYLTYIYIPIESITSEIIKIENKEMQALMSTDILEDIDKILDERNIPKGNRTISLIDYLNSNLDEYMNKINDTISRIDESYAYKVEQGYKKNLRPSDVRNRILEAYFSIRTLKKDKKEIHELSSGEQRIALIDIATAFLKNTSRSNKRKTILAIDEPESSLHISKAFKQFERLQSLVQENVQLILTSHWYGSLPFTTTGNLNYIELKSDYRINVSTYDLNNYFEKRGSLPEDVQMKSYFDLTSAILSSMRSENTNWIICEGSDDKLYLSHYLSSSIANLKILCVGGCSNVIKLYKYLYTPFQEKDEKKAVNSKILCLIDTDDVIYDLEINSEVKGKLRLARMQPERDGQLKLMSVKKNGFYYSTEMEDCLTPKKYYKSIKDVIEKSDDANLLELFKKFSYKEGSTYSRIKNEKDSILEPLELIKYEDKKTLFDFLDDHHIKYIIAQNYTSREIEERPLLFTLISQYFNKTN
ncbi:ATP-dependent endonuclease [Paenibacillus chungangensis]|uniref:ATP-dependent endonuclease n=1 Tax=Paenibacillus chungangensis TaxID=696535 RepID=A0ABW3HRN4_9BACL